MLNRGNRAYVTLDGTILRMAAKEELELFLQRYRPPVLTRKARGRFLFGRSRSRTPPMPGCVRSCDPLHRSTSLQRQSSRSFRSSHIATATSLFIVWHSIAHPHGLCPPSVAQRKSGCALYCTAGFRSLCGDERRGNGVRRGRSSARGRAAQAFFGKSCVQTAMTPRLLVAFGAFARYTAKVRFQKPRAAGEAETQTQRSPGLSARAGVGNRRP